MLRSVVLIVFTTSVFGAHIAPISERIIGGTPAEKGAFPYQVSIRHDGAHACGGSILNENWILTAAQCVYGFSPFSISVIVGSDTLMPAGVEHSVNKIGFHGNYDPEYLINDIAVLHVKDPIEFNEKVQPIQITDGNTDGEVDCILTGWGTTTLGGSFPNDLQSINLKTITLEECQKAQSPNEVFTNQICTFTKSGEGACHGDSGSPLVENGKQIGLLSWGRPCALGYPDVYTRLYSYKDWIQDEIQD